MNTMCRYPENRTAFHTERAANGEKVFEPAWHLVRTVGVQPVIAHADSQTNGDPVKHDSSKKGRPTKEEWSCKGSDVKNRHHECGRPIQPLIWIGRKGKGSYGRILHRLVVYLSGRRL